MNATPKLDEIKSRAQFFKQGSIIPRRILACSKRRQQHLFRFGSDSWVIPTKTGYLVICNTDQEGASAINIKRCRNVGDMTFGHKHGRKVLFQGNSFVDPSKHESDVLKALREMNLESLPSVGVIESFTPKACAAHDLG